MTLRLFALLLSAAVLCVGWAASCVIWRAAEVNELIGPLEERFFRRLTVVAVGTGSPYENPERLGPSTAIAWRKQVSLVDVGRGIAEGLRISKIPVSQPSRVLLTSLLPENTVGIDDLLFTGWRGNREHAIEVIGPVGTRAFVESLERAYRTGREGLGGALDLPREGIRVEVVEAGEGFTADWDGLQVKAAALQGGPLPALAWRFEAGGRVVVVSGVGWDEDRLVTFSQGAHMLVHEAVYVPPPEDVEDAGVIADPERLRREAEIHTSLLEIGELGRRAGVDALVITRMRPPPFYDIQVTGFVDDTFPGTVWVPADGDEIEP
jgi:ribonuclease BN (tRNA processing enzyme)